MKKELDDQNNLNYIENIEENIKYSLALIIILYNKTKNFQI